MSEEKIRIIAENITGLKRYEWSKLKIAVEKMYDSASCKLSLDDTELIQKNISLELNGFNCNQLTGTKRQHKR